MIITIKHNFPEVQKALDQMRIDVGNKAVSSALNKSAAQAKTAMSREIRDEFVLPAAKVSQALRVNRAVASGARMNLEASLESPSQRGRSLNLASFGARQTAKGVSIKIKRNGPRKLIPGAFLIKGGRTVMIRIGKARLPIKAVQTINIASMFNTRRINARVVKMIEEKFPAIFENESRFFINKFNETGKV